jgi:hypothetical protein
VHKHTHMFANGHIEPYWAILGHFAIWAILRGMAQDGSGYLIMALAQDWLKTGSKYYKHHLCMVKTVVHNIHMHNRPFNVRENRFICNLGSVGSFWPIRVQTSSEGLKWAQTGSNRTDNI